MIEKPPEVRKMNAEQATSNRDWIEQELGKVSLGDARLDRRLLESLGQGASFAS